MADVTRTLLAPFALGRGTLERVSIAAPGAGVLTALRTVPGGFWERPVVISFLLTTDATVANRAAMIRYQDQDNTIYAEVQTGTLQPASNAFRFTFLSNLGAAPAGIVGRVVAAMSEMWVPTGFDYGPVNFNGQAGDTLTLIEMLIERAPLGVDGYTIGRSPVSVAEALGLEDT